MLPYLSEQYGNPSSKHQMGENAKKAIETARIQVAKAINADPDQIFFTSGATESNNWITSNYRVVICSRVEHHSILRNHKCLPMNYLPLDDQLYIDMPDLVTHMMVNNETGIIYDIKEMAKICHRQRIPFHTDATQAFGHIPIDVNNLDVDFMSLSGHKFHAPKGVGILYCKDESVIKSLISGGAQERNLRAGTENVAAIVGMGMAAELYNYSRDTQENIASLRNELESTILNNLSDVIINGDRKDRISSISNMSFEGIDGETLLLMLDTKGICVSSGSACNSNSIEPSHVLKEMRIPDKYIHGTIRVSLSEFTTKDEIAYTSREIIKAVKTLRNGNQKSERGEVHGLFKNVSS